MKAKGSTASQPAGVMPGRPPQSAPRGVPSSQPRPDEFGQRTGQSYQNLAGPIPQSVVVAQGALPGQLQTQGQAHLPGQQHFYPGQGRQMRIPRHPPQNTPMYSSPPGGHMVPILPTGGPPFIPQPQNPQFMHQHVDFGQISMAGAPQPQYRPQQPMPSQFPPVSGPSQPQGHFGYPPQPMYQMAPQTSHVFFAMRGPPPQMPGMPPFPPQNYQEPRTREKKIIQIKDPSSNKDVTQEILAGGHSSGSVTGSTGGTPNTTPDVSGHSSSSSTPPLTLQQQNEANVRAQFAAQVAATLVISSEEKSLPPSTKPVDNSITIQKATDKPVAGIVKINEPTVPQKSDGASDTNISGSNSLVMEVEGSVKLSGELPVERRDSENDNKNEEQVAVGISTTLESADNSKEACIADPSISEKDVSPNALVQPSTDDSTTDVFLIKSEVSSSSTGEELVAENEPVASQDNEPQSASEMEPVNKPNVLNGPVVLSREEEKEEKSEEEVKAVENVDEVEVSPSPDVAVQTGVEDVTESMEQCTTEPQIMAVEESEKIEMMSTASDSEDAVESKKLNGHEPDMKPGAVSKNPVDNQAIVKEMKKKKQKHRLKDMEKRSSEKEPNMMDAYTERPVKEQVAAEPDEGTVDVAEQKELATDEEVEEGQSEEETWEDKEATWSQLETESEPQQPEGGKLTYEREFLLQFQYTPVCTLKPAGLPDLEVVLGTARPPPKAGYQANRIPNTGGGDMFLPGFMRPQTIKNNRENANRGRSRMPPKKVINLITPPAVDLKRTENRWVRPSELSKTMDEQHQKTEDLFRKVRSILNKLTPQKFQTLTQQIIDLDVDTAERLEGVIDLIFEKAIDEPGFSVAYANMCRCLIPKKVVVAKEGKEVAVTFRKILLNKCQKEFEKEKSDEKKIHEKLEELTDKGLTEEEVAQRKEEIREEEQKAKRRTLGNIRFIGELFKLKMLTESIMHDCVVKLIRSNDEESFECLCKLLVTIGKDLDHEKAKPRVDQYFQQIHKIIQARITSSRVRFMMQDIVDLRCNNWIPRREDNNPKTIDQIHKEAADEAKKTQIMLQQAKQEKRQRGNMGGRDSPRPQVAAPNDETWTTVGRGPRNISVDPKKFQNIKQRPVDSENISLGPGGRGYGAWARGSSGGTGSVGAGAGSSAAAATVGGEADSRPSGNRYSALAGERRASAPARQNSSGAGRQEPRSPVVTGGRRAPTGPLEREKALEAVRAVTQTKRNSQEREGGRESPKLPVDAPPSAASAASSSMAVSTSPSLEPELTEDEMKKKAMADLKEYLHINDLPGAIQCFKDLNSPSTHHVFVSVAFNHSMEKHSKERTATGKLMHSLLREGVLTAEQYLKGIQEIFEFAEDMEIDIPLVWEYLGEIIGATAFDGVLPLQLVSQHASRFMTKKLNEAKLFAQILNTAMGLSSPEDVKAVWRRTGLSLNGYFESQQDAEDFAKEKNIEFALRQASSSQDTSSATQHSARIQEELRTLILKRKARNKELFDWIDRTTQHPDFKSVPFIKALVTAVCEETLEKEAGGSCKCNSELLKDRKAVLQRCIDHNSELELQALYAVQALCVRLDHPPGFMKSYFDCLYDEEIITEESYFLWESSEDPQEQNGKGLARTATSEFFRWLRSAPEESGEDS